MHRCDQKRHVILQGGGRQVIPWKGGDGTKYSAGRFRLKFWVWFLTDHWAAIHEKARLTRGPAILIQLGVICFKGVSITIIEAPDKRAIPRAGSRNGAIPCWSGFLPLRREMGCYRRCRKQGKPDNSPVLTFGTELAMVEIVMQYVIPAASLALAGWDRKRGGLWLFVGAYYGSLALIFGRVDPSSLTYLSFLMLAPLVNSLVLIGLVLVVEKKIMNPQSQSRGFIGHMLP